METFKVKFWTPKIDDKIEMECYFGKAIAFEANHFIIMDASGKFHRVHYNNVYGAM